MTTQSDDMDAEDVVSAIRELISALRAFERTLFDLFGSEDD